MTLKIIIVTLKHQFLLFVCTNIIFILFKIKQNTNHKKTNEIKVEKKVLPGLWGIPKHQFKRLQTINRP